MNNFKNIAGTALLHVNGVEKGVFLRDIQTNRPLHFVADVYGKSTVIELTGDDHY